MPASFNPKIWWLELGMNDLGRTQCSEEVVILGILRVVVSYFTISMSKCLYHIVSISPLCKTKSGRNSQQEA
jgi:hypothetical protein